jgi:hypothetical protein
MADLKRRFDIEPVRRQTFQSHNCVNARPARPFTPAPRVTHPCLKIKVRRDKAAVQSLHVSFAAARSRSGVLQALALVPEAIPVAPSPALPSASRLCGTRGCRRARDRRLRGPRREPASLLEAKGSILPSFRQTQQVDPELSAHWQERLKAKAQSPAPGRTDAGSSRLIL